METVSIKNVVTRDFVLVFFSLLFMIAPGLAVIALYLPEWLNNFDSWKLLLMSLTISTPVVIAFWFEIGISEGKSFRATKDYDAFTGLFLSLFTAAMMIYLSLGIAKIFEYYFHFTHGLGFFLKVAFDCILGGLLVVSIAMRSDRKKSKQ